ncbi:transmembrane protein 39A-like [Tribolium madens]|uniref:transmembrane protein 39A-like n=1 Tax=Tribolium madens TaxID=41895 RepID=UPI001CF71F3C|nr:transmembrane protein 39A-like [Tribolium madens]
MPTGNRRLPRTLRSSIPSMMSGFGSDMSHSRYAMLGGGVPTLPILEQAAAPKHFPFPNTPVDDDLFFEFLMFMFSAICAGLQFLHLYRTVWWLPHSYNRQAMNFYLIDLNLVAFIVILLSRRLIYIVGCRILERSVPAKYLYLSYTCYRIILFAILFTLLSCCAYFVIQNHPIVNILYLCYPILVYLILFGCKVTAFFELVTWNSSSIPPLHACRSNASEVREEVENLKTNFNNRMKQILFSSVVNAYYTGFIPSCFAQNHLHYDVYWATQHVIFIFLSSFVAYATHILSLRYCDILHRSALHLGIWDKLETRNMLLVNNNWNEETLWPYGALVKHGRDLYRAQGECNASEPGNTTYSRFYLMFKNPSCSLSILLSVHVAMVLLQLVLLVRSIVWYNIISITFILFFNYYVLYKVGRDYLVSSKMYEEERAMHNKLNLH